MTAGEALRLGAAAGVAPEALLPVLNGASGRSAVTEVNWPRWIIPGTFDSGFSAGLMRKDVGLALALARELDVRNVDTVSVKSYHHQERADAVILKAPDAELMGDGTGILVIDDLVDSGKTLELVRSKYPKAHFATVYAKPQGRPMVDTFITEVSQDTWIFFPWDMALQYVQPYRGTD